MSVREKILSCIRAKELAHGLLHNEFKDQESFDAACLALEFRLRRQKDTLLRSILKKVQHFVDVGVALRKKRDKEGAEEDVCQLYTDYEKNAGVLVNNQQIQQHLFNATPPTPIPEPCRNLGAINFERDPTPELLKRRLSTQSKVSLVKEAPQYVQPPKRTKKEHPVPSTSAESASNACESDDIHPSLDQKRTVRDNVEESKKFKLIQELEEFFPKFNLRSLKTKVRVLPCPNNADPGEWIHNSILEICDWVKRDILPGDLVALSITNEHTPERPIYINARMSKTLDAAAVFNSFHKVCQSNNDFLIDGALSFELQHVAMPVGGRNKKYKFRGLERNQWVLKKRSMVEVQNEGNYCLAVALILAMAHHETNVQTTYKSYNFNSLRRRQNGKDMLTLVHHLLLDSNVDLENGGGYQELQKFQDYLTDYKITVYNSRDGKTVYFEGNVPLNRKKISLYLEDGHYDVILNCAGAFNCRHYCDSCHFGTQDSKPHRCSKACPRCRSTPICENEDLSVICVDCNRKFHGPDCYRKHKLRNGSSEITCDILKQCKDCNVTYKIYEKRSKHLCDEIFCLNCYMHVPYSHQCFIKKKYKPKRDDSIMKRTKYVFFDLECTQNTKKSGTENTFVHEVNLCVSQQSCINCIDIKDPEKCKPDYACKNCGPRQKVYETDVIKSFMHDLIQPDPNFDHTIVISHNGGAYDMQFILRYLASERQDLPPPKMIMNGAKIMSLEIMNIKFIDSINFLPMALSKLPAAFGLTELKKGYMPHLFNIAMNSNYEGKIPAVKYFSPDTMTKQNRKKFLEWYGQEVERNQLYNFRNELINYCVSDVCILREACLNFRELMMEAGDIDCFREAITIASSCNLIFRRNFLEDQTIGLVPKGGYRWRDTQSRAAIEWLVWEEHQRKIQIMHAARGKEKHVFGCKVDGYAEVGGKQICLEFHGCWYHGCRKCYGDSDQKLSDDPYDTMAQRRERTETKTRKLRSKGFVVLEKWQCEFEADKVKYPEIQEVIDASGFTKSIKLNPRDAFRGGRTNAIKLYCRSRGPHGKIKYVDFTSLYPYINKYKKYPIGHPKVYVGDECPTVDKCEGFVSCTVRAPKDLYLPVLPVAMHNKLMFFLCKTCAEEESQTSCTHSDPQREFQGTWVSEELKKAVSLGYVVTKMHEVWNYDTTTYDPLSRKGGIFPEYINTFLKIKQESSDWPQGCDTEAKKRAYIADYDAKEGILLDYDKICNNPGRRALAKLCLNSIWGKFAQKNNMSQYCIIMNASDMYAKIAEPGIVIKTIKILSADSIMICYEYEAEIANTLHSVSLAVAAYTTAQARLHLYKYLELLDQRVLYFDTDSIIFTQEEDEFDLPTGNYLGELTDELRSFGEGSYISEYVSGGPKNYAFAVTTPGKEGVSDVIKVRGIRINHSNENTVSLATLKSMITNKTGPVIVHDKQKILRTPDHEVITTSQSRVYQVVYNKRRIVPGTHNTLPYGYVD